MPQSSIRLPSAFLLSLALGACAFEAINKDAMTMQACRDRLNQPKSQRIKSEDPRVDLDAICVNMLSPKDLPKIGTGGKASKP